MNFEKDPFGGMKPVEAPRITETPEEARARDERVRNFLSGLKPEDVLLRSDPQTEDEDEDIAESGKKTPGGIN